MGDACFLRQELSEYLADRGRYSGSILGLVDSEPELFGRWMKGEDIDRPTPAKARGSVVHALLLEGEGEFRRRFARYPNRNEGMTEEKVIPEGQKTAKKTGRHIPQDGSPAGAAKSMICRSAFEKAFARDWRAANAGKTIWYPEDEAIVAAMVKAVRANEQAMALLHPTGGAPEVTVHWSHKGVPLRGRFDFLRIAERAWVELKTYDPSKHGRLNTLDPQATMRWVRGQGFARKSAMLHDGFEAAAGEKATGWWILVEAIEKDPRVSIVRDVFDSKLADLGRDGCADWGIRGYYSLAELAADMQRHNDYRHDCCLDVVEGFTLPAALLTSMSFDPKAGGPVEHDVPEIQGGVPLEEFRG